MFGKNLVSRIYAIKLPEKYATAGEIQITIFPYDTGLF